MKLRLCFDKTIDTRLIKRSIKHKVQRHTRGFGDDSTWSLDYFYAKTFVKTITRFKELNDRCYPSNLDTYEEWEQILDEMIEGFQVVVSEFDNGVGFLTKEEQAKVDLAMFNFSRWWRALWW